MKLNKDGDYVYVGSARLGNEYIDVLAGLKTSGGSFAAAPNFSMHKDHKVGTSYIVVGMDQHLWRDVFDVLMHETAEYAHLQICCRFEPNANVGISEGRYVFITTHEQFSEVISRTSFFVNSMWHPLWKVWKKIQKKKKRS